MSAAAPAKAGAALQQQFAPLLWTARPNMLLFWGMAALGCAIAAIPLTTLAAPPTACTGPCGDHGLTYLFGTLALGLGLLALPLVLLIPLGGLDLRYQLTAQNLTISRRILGWHRRRDLAVAGHYFTLSRGNYIYIYPRPSTPGAQRGMLICLSRRERDALRDALPQGAWR